MQACNYVVVGAGVYGAAVARELSLIGQSVLLVEAEDVASGASGGIGRRGIRADGRSDAELIVMRRAHELWPVWAEALGATEIFERIGHLDLFELPAHVRVAEERVRRQVAAGIPSRLVGPDELRSLEPALSPAVIGAVSCPLDGVSDHTATTQALVQAARSAGAQFLRTRVRALELEAGRVARIVVDGAERIDVGRELLLFVNADINELIEPALGIRLPLFEALPQALVTRAIRPSLPRHLIAHFSRRLHMKALPDGRAMITGGFIGAKNPLTGRGEPTEESVQGNFAEAVAVFPSLAGVEIEVAVADRPEAITVDSLPVIDRLAENLLVGTGFSGQGFAPAPAYVELVVEWLTTGKKPALIEPFRCGR